MLKIYNTIKLLTIVAVFSLTPALVSADSSYGSYDGWSPYEDTYSGWNTSEFNAYGSYNAPYSYDAYDYTPYSYDTGYNGYNGYNDYGGGNQGYVYPDYAQNAPQASYGANIYGGYAYPTVGGGNSTPAVSTSNAVATAVSTNNNNNVNNNTNINNVYVYTNPSGTAIVNNPAHQRLDGYCTVTPSNPRLGQSVTATAYASGGIGSYTYQWGGDLSSGYGASTSFTSYNTGTKNINVTIRSGEEVVTRSCSVTFVQESNNQDFSAACYPSVQNTTVGQTITWRVTVTGNPYYASDYYGYNSGYNTGYTYSWTGSDSLYGNGSTVSKTYTYPGTKSATVSVSNGYRTISTTCSAVVNQTYSYVAPTSGTPVSGVYIQPDQIKITSGRPISGVYLNDLPATGIDLSWKQYMIAIMVVILTSVAFLLFRNRKNLILNRG